MKINVTKWTQRMKTVFRIEAENRYVISICIHIYGIYILKLWSKTFRWKTTQAIPNRTTPHHTLCVFSMCGFSGFCVLLIAFNKPKIFERNSAFSMIHTNINRSVSIKYHNTTISVSCTQFSTYHNVKDKLPQWHRCSIWFFFSFIRFWNYIYISVCWQIWWMIWIWWWRKRYSFRSEDSWN